MILNVLNYGNGTHRVQAAKSMIKEMSKSGNPLSEVRTTNQNQKTVIKAMQLHN